MYRTYLVGETPWKVQFYWGKDYQSSTGIIFPIVKICDLNNHPVHSTYADQGKIDIIGDYDFNPDHSPTDLSYELQKDSPNSILIILLLITIL